MKTLSIRTVILAAIVGLQVLAATITIALSYLSSERAVLGQSQQLMAASMNHVVERTRAFMKPKEALLAASRNLLEGGALSAGSAPILERYFFEQLAAFPSVSGLYYGDAKGGFLFVNRSQAVEGARYRTKIISRAGTGATLIHRNDGFARVAVRQDAQDAYDPRARPWYADAVAAGQTIWTDPYIFYTARVPGITIAAPVRRPDGSVAGVVGIDVEIATLSSFLDALDVSENSAALILTAAGEVIARSGPSPLADAAMEGTDPRLARIEEIGDPAARAALDALGTADPSETRFARYEAGERIFNAGAAPLTTGTLDWTVAVYTPEADVLGAIVDGRTRTIWLAVAIALVAIAAGWALSRMMTRSMGSLAAFADRVGRGERPDPGDLPDGFVEVRQVSTAFRRLLLWLGDYRARNDALNGELRDWSRNLEVRVEERTAALRDANAQLRREIATRAEAERRLAEEIGRHKATSGDLRLALEETEQASRAKTRFLSSMSHELRTPLNAIIGFGQMLSGEGGALTKAREREYAGYIQMSGERLLKLINEVMDLAQIEAGRTLLAIEAVDPRHVTERVVAETGMLARQAGIAMTDGTRGQALPPVRADAARLTQCLVNLVANAIKYNRPGGTIHIACGVDGEALRLSVRDTGIGIPAARQAEAFETFNRLGAEGSGVEGSGVGLSVTKELVERMGGAVGFESEEGVGSTFWIDLPLDGQAAGGGTVESLSAARDRLSV